MRRFRSSAPKAKNGFVARRIVSSRPDRRNNAEEIPSDFSRILCPFRGFAAPVYRGLLSQVPGGSGAEGGFLTFLR
jgi:hypothetical protein